MLGDYHSLEAAIGGDATAFSCAQQVCDYMLKRVRANTLHLVS